LDLRAQLEAVYEARTIVIPEPYPTRDFSRDDESERAAWELVGEAGLVAVEDEGLVARGDHAIAFWQSGIAALQASTAPPVDVLLSEALAKVKIRPPVDATLRVKLVGGWLDTKLTFKAAEVAVEIAALRAALASQSRWVIAEDGSLSRIDDKI